MEMGDNPEFVFLVTTGEYVFYLDIRSREMHRVYKIPYEHDDQHIQQINPLMMIWPFVFPVLKDDPIPGRACGQDLAGLIVLYSRGSVQETRVAPGGPGLEEFQLQIWSHKGDNNGELTSEGEDATEVGIIEVGDNAEFVLLVTTGEYAFYLDIKSWEICQEPEPNSLSGKEPRMCGYTPPPKFKFTFLV
ncbi:hypothetical protein E2562_010319 [Oryza meyeriana var. granulata]|uniref:F-box protein AT5G49610-like beta-propeller domain-containing protein n=1 Tax=Oryza meyeriana var. granulata TaxID=110450 RepID=A0A6G1F6B4_9ORYZ|nr:hypothetical protein E2562_010319 [Oryza meyeriana var. granulata]